MFTVGAQLTMVHGRKAHPHRSTSVQSEYQISSAGYCWRECKIDACFHGMLTTNRVHPLFVAPPNAVKTLGKGGFTSVWLLLALLARVGARGCVADGG